MATIRRFSTLLLLLTVYFQRSECQVGGLSLTKIRTYAASVVEIHKIEFEPSFMIGVSPVNPDVINPDQEPSPLEKYYKYSSDLNFRLTYGLCRKVEAGVVVNGGMSIAAFGTKFLFVDRPAWKSSFIAGLTFNGLNVSHIPHQTLPELSNTYSAGLINTLKFSPAFSVDADIQVSRFFSAEYNELTRLYINSDAGYYLNDKFQLISGLNYSKGFSSEPFSQLMGATGITFQGARQFVIMLNVPYTIYTKGTSPYYGFSMAVCITFD